MNKVASAIVLLTIFAAAQTVFATAPTAQTQAASSITTSSAQLNSYVNPNGLSTTIYFQYGLTTSYGSSTSLGGIGTAAGNYGFTVSGLSPNTTYHFRIVAYNSSGTTYGGYLTFTTSTSVTAPTAQTQAASLITTSSAQLNSYVNPNGGSTTIYFQYGLTTSYGSTTISGGIGTTAGNYGTTISGLSANTTYHFRVVAYNSGGTSYGSDLTFTTSATAPTATTQAATLITSTSAQLNSYVNPNGASTTIYYQYGLTTSYGSTTIAGGIGTTAGNYGTTASSLTSSTTYHFRIVAYNSGGTSYGSDLTFTTLASAPAATTQAATSITSTSAQLNSYVDPSGASTTIYYQYGLTTSYGSTTISGNIGTTAGNYGTTVSGLTPNTTYHFRIVATSSGGTTYGSDMTFSTGVGPTATTQAATAINSTSAQLNSYVNPNGQTTTIYYQYGLTTSYGSTTITGNIGTTAGNYGTTVSGLSANTTYHFRIVATNSIGTSYGSDLTFTTTSGVPTPTVTTLAANPVTTTTATLNSSVNPNGSSTTIYFQYGLTTSYGSTTPTGNIGTSAGNFGYAISSLTPNTTYHFQVVAYNSGGTSYGGDLTFTTSATTGAPGVTTLAANNVTSVGAQLNGSINPNGSATTAYFEYGTTTSYGSQTPSGNFGTTSQNISYTISSLSPGTIYHYRLTAYNSNGTTHGSDQTFTTPGTSNPTAQTLAATSVTSSSAQLNGTLNPNGLNTAANFEYGLTTAYGSSAPSGNFGTASQNIGYALSGLTPNTTYHFRLDAVNSSGNSYGVDQSFTTLPTTTTAQNAWVSGTGGLGLRLRASPSLSGTILLVMPEGAEVTLNSGTQSADGYLWRNVTYNGQTGWADSEYLVFSPSGTPTPPAGPVSLQQFQSDGISPLAQGGTATSSSVVLVATPSGSSSQQFYVQFEVRPAGTAFSNPTITSPVVQGGTAAVVTVPNLANQGYHWRARVLDGNGVPSSWVSFSGNASDFTVNATASPIASFSWSPSEIFVGTPVTFTAQAASQSGLTFSWNFGGTPATGGTVNQTFTQSGDVAVTLTVTDSQGNQSQKTLTVSVASSDLVSRINATAGQSESMLDDILANATSSAEAADYFAGDVQAAPNLIAVKGAFAEVALVIDIGGAGDTTKLAQDCINWTRQTYGNAAANELTLELAGHYTADSIRDDFRESLAEWVVSNGKQGLSYQQMWVPQLTTIVSQQKAEIEQLREQAVIAAGSLNPTQSAQLVQDLQARLVGNYALQASYDQNANLPILFQQYKSSDESGWTTYKIGQHLFTVSSGLLDTALGGVAGIVATAAFSATQAEQDIFNTLASQSAEAQLMSLSISMTGQGFVTVNQISTNIETGLQDVIQTQPASPSSGQIVSITPYTQGTLRTYNLIPTWFASSAYANVVIQNTGTQTATYRVEAFLTKTFVTGQLPGGFLGIGQRQYQIPVATAQDGITLTAGAQQTVTLTFLTGDGGQVPEGQNIVYTLTARAANGYCRQDQQNQQFGTIYLDENGNPIDPALVAAASKPQPPLQSSALTYPGTNMCAIQISVQNPFDVPTMVNLQQALPDGAVIIDPAGGNFSNGQLSWSLNLQPGDFQYFQVVLQLTAPGSTITNTVASIYDNVNATWVNFTNTPTVSQMITAPAPQIQGAGFSNGAFGLNLQALIPGVYTIQGTTNFINWIPISTVTNDAGSIQINDLDAQNHPSKFYRALRQ